MDGNLENQTTGPIENIETKLDLIKLKLKIYKNRTLNIIAKIYTYISKKLDRPLLLPAFKTLIILIVFAILLPVIYKSYIIRKPFANTLPGNYIFCMGKNLCNDARCMGEVYRECNPCETGTARSVYKNSCGENLYSDCKFKDNKCDDRNFLYYLNRLR